MSPTQAARFTRAATRSHPTGHPVPAPPDGDRTPVQDGDARKRTPASDHGQPDRSLQHQRAHRGSLSPIRSTTPATTLASRRSPSLGDPHSRTPLMGPTSKDRSRLSTVITATLSAELESRVPADLVADIVRTVLDESRQAAHDWGFQPTMIEARRRLERLIRAGSSR